LHFGGKPTSFASLPLINRLSSGTSKMADCIRPTLAGLAESVGKHAIFNSEL